MYNAGGSEPCWKGNCQACDHIITTNPFTTKASGKVFRIQSGTLDCYSEKVLYLPRCKISDLKYNYKSKHRSFQKGKQNVPQKRFHSHYVQDYQKVLMIGKSLYLRSVKRTNNLKKEKHFGNTD